MRTFHLPCLSFINLCSWMHFKMTFNERGKIRSCPSDHLATTEVCEFSARDVVSAGLWFNAFSHMIAKREFVVQTVKKVHGSSICVCVQACVCVYSCSVCVFNLNGRDGLIGNQINIHQMVWLLGRLAFSDWPWQKGNIRRVKRHSEGGRGKHKLVCFHVPPPCWFWAKWCD